MLDHVGLVVSDFGRAKSFFESALAPLGYTKLMEFSGAAGFGAGKPDFWISQGAAPKPVHVAFAASDRKIVATVLLGCERNIIPTITGRS